MDHWKFGPEINRYPHCEKQARDQILSWQPAQTFKADKWGTLEADPLASRKLLGYWKPEGDLEPEPTS